MGWFGLVVRVGNCLGFVWEIMSRLFLQTLSWDIKSGSRHIDYRHVSFLSAYSSMDHDVLRREKLMNEVSANIESTLTISLALKVAAKFSNGAAVMEGKGQLGKSYRGTFNICYWVQVEGLSKLWVVRFPLIGLLPIDAMTAKFSCEIATLKFLREKTEVRVPELIGYGTSWRR